MKSRKYIFLIVVILFTIICIMAVKKRDNKIIEKEYVTEKINIEIEESVKEYPKEKVLENYKGYDVCAKIEIPSISNRETSWRTLVEKWSWGPLGELLRQEAERKQKHGAAM